MKTLIKRNFFVAVALLLVVAFTFMLSACSDGENPDGDEFPSNAIKISNSTELISAINNQKDNQYWVLAAGTYDIDPTQTTIELNGETGFYLPIVKKGITIYGNGNVKLISTHDTPNGSLSTQNFITIVGDDVTIRNVTIVCKKEVNKAVEIFGKNTTLKNVTFNAPDDYEFAGSIYLHQTGLDESADGDVGTLTLENVTLNKGRITATYANKGKIVFNNVTIDWTDVAPDLILNSIYPMQNFDGKNFEYEGASTVHVKISETELGTVYDAVIENIIEGVDVVNVDEQ